MQSLWILICLSIVREFSSGKEKLYIGTFYGVNVSSIGWSSEGVMPAVQMALDHVNKDQSILPEYTLYQDWRDSKVTIVAQKTSNSHYARSTFSEIASSLFLSGYTHCVVLRSADFFAGSRSQFLVLETKNV